MGANLDTNSDGQRDERIALHNEALFLCAQSHAIHGDDWDETDHLAFLEGEIGVTAETPLTVVAWPEGHASYPAEKFVAMWLRHPARCFESARRPR